MSTDTQALFEVADANRELEVIRDCAKTAKPGPIRRVSERYLEYWKQKEWEYSTPNTLIGPGGFIIEAKGQIIRVYHWLRYSAFTQQGEDGRLVLDALCCLCRLVGSNEMVLLHEMLPWRDGANLDAICTRLIDEIGPPAENWAELSSSDLFSPRCWLRLRLDKEAESGLLAHLASGTQPNLEDPWAVWRDRTKYSAPDETNDILWPSKGKLYLADILYARPLQAGKSVCGQEVLSSLLLKAITRAEAYRRAYAWGHIHATKAPGEVRFLGVSRLTSFRGTRTELLTPEQSEDIKRVRAEVWPNGIGDLNLRSLLRGEPDGDQVDAGE